MIALQEQESNRELFKEFIKSFYLIKNNAADLEILARSFELKLLRATGYGFDFEKCCVCGNKINKSNYISIKYYGGTCNECNKANGVNVNYGTYNVLKFLERTPMENIHKILVNRQIKDELYKVLNIFINQSYSKRPKSLEIFNYLKEE